MSFCGKSVSTEVPAHHLTPGTILNSKYYVGRRSVRADLALPMSVVTLYLI